MPLSDRIAPVVRSLADTVVGVETDGGEPAGDQDLDWVAEQLRLKLDQMPSYMSVGMVAATVLFDVAPLPRTGRLFRRLDADRRRAQLRHWRNSALPFLPDFVDFYEKMGVFIYWTLVEERHAAEGGA